MDVIAGQALVIDFEFRRRGVLADPTIVRVLARSPTGTRTEIVYPSDGIVRVAVGQYQASVLADIPGTWAFRVVGVGVVDAVQEGSINVQPSLVI